MLSKLKYYINLEKAYFRIGFINMTQYPLDTVILIISMLVREFSSFIVVIGIMNAAKILAGWSLNEVCLLFSFNAIIESIGQFCFDNVWSIRKNIKNGDLDIYMVRPASIFFQQLGQRIHFQALVGTAFYFLIFIYFLKKVTFYISIGKIFFILESILFGVIINSGIYLIFNSMNFWFMEAKDISDMVQNIRQLVNFPIKIFPIVIQFLVTYIIPFAFSGYYPIAYITDKTNSNIPLVLPIVSLLIITISIIVWKKGISRYDSSGT